MTVNPTKLDIEVTYTNDEGALFANVVFDDEHLNMILSKLESQNFNPFEVSPLTARVFGGFWTQTNVLMLIRAAVVYAMSTAHTTDHVFVVNMEGGSWAAIRLNRARAASVAVAL